MIAEAGVNHNGDLDIAFKLRTLKIASSEIINDPLLSAHAQTRCNLILSTGNSNLSEIKGVLYI